MTLPDYKYWTVLIKKTNTLVFFFDIKGWDVLVYKCYNYDPHEPDSYFEFDVMNISYDTDWDREWKNVSSPAFMNEMVQQMFDNVLFGDDISYVDNWMMDDVEEWYGL